MVGLRLALEDALHSTPAIHRHSDCLQASHVSLEAPAASVSIQSARSPSPATTTPPSASSTRASTSSGPCAWALLGVEDRPRYTPSTTFETFPFPDGLTPDIPAADYAGDPRAQAIAAAAAELNARREAWLNPRRSRRAGAGGGGGLSRPGAAEGRRGGGGAEEAHADQPLQRAAGVAGPRPCAARCRRRRGLRLGRGLAGGAARGGGDPRAAVRAQSEAGA